MGKWKNGAPRKKKSVLSHFIFTIIPAGTETSTLFFTQHPTASFDCTPYQKARPGDTLRAAFCAERVSGCSALPGSALVSVFQTTIQYCLQEVHSYLIEPSLSQGIFFSSSFLLCRLSAAYLTISKSSKETDHGSVRGTQTCIVVHFGLPACGLSIYSPDGQSRPAWPPAADNDASGLGVCYCSAVMARLVRRDSRTAMCEALERFAPDSVQSYRSLAPVAVGRAILEALKTFHA
jgi:hypothetical protein